MTSRRRERLRLVLGREAESLVARYTDYDWSRVPDQMEEGDRPVIWMRIANEVDDCSDRGLLYAGPRKRQSGEDRIARFAGAACELKMPKLAEELQAAFAHNQGTLPEGLRASRDGSFTIAQPLRALIRGCVRHSYRVLRRRTGARGR